MDRNEALASLDAVRHTRGKLAQRSQWPLWRHALFGFVEATFIFGISLPFAGMASYPKGARERLETAAHREYLETWQTRRVGGR